MTESTVAIIIVNWNTYDFSKSCINQLKSLSYKSFNIILIDNGSYDGSGEKLRQEFPEIEFFKNEKNEGFTGGNNKGIELALRAHYEYIMLLNNDTYFEKEFLNPLVKFLDMNQHVGAVQPLIYEKETPKKVWHAGGRFNKYRGSSKSIKEEIDLTQPYSSEWLTGCAFLVRSSVVNQIGLLNPTFFAYFEDVDWSFKIKALGLNLYIVPESIIFHEVSGSTKSKKKGNEGYLSPLAHYLNVRNQLLLLKSHPKKINRFTAWTFQFLKISTFLAYFLFRFRFKKLKAAFDGLRDGINHPSKSNKLPEVTCYL